MGIVFIMKKKNLGVLHLPKLRSNKVSIIPSFLSNNKTGKKKYFYFPSQFIFVLITSTLERLVEAVKLLNLFVKPLPHFLDLHFLY